MEEDTDGTVAAWHTVRHEVIDPSIDRFGGRIVKHTGDGFLAEYPTAQDAVRSAIEMRDGLAANPLNFRIGINIGDIIDDGEDIHGEGVNVAARLAGLAAPGAIYISGEVHALVRNRLDVAFVDRGEHEVKHVSHPVHVFAMAAPTEEESVSARASTAAPSVPSTLGLKPSIVVLPFENLSADPEQEYFADGITEDLITTKDMRCPSPPEIPRLFCRKCCTMSRRSAAYHFMSNSGADDEDPRLLQRGMSCLRCRDRPAAEMALILRSRHRVDRRAS